MLNKRTISIPSEQPNKLARSILNDTYAKAPTLVLYKNRGVSDHDTIRAASTATRTSKEKDFTTRDLLDMLFPPLKLRYLDYGNFLYGHKIFYSSNTTPTVTDLTSYPQLKKWSIPKGQQLFVSGIYLPFYSTPTTEMKPTSTATYTSRFANTPGIEDFFLKFANTQTGAGTDSRTQGWNFYNTEWSNVAQDRNPAYLPTPQDNYNPNNYAIHYYGGEVVHHFANTGETAITLQIYEHRPRSPMVWDTLTRNLPVHLAIQDNACNDPRFSSGLINNGTTPFSAVTEGSLDSGNLAFNYSQMQTLRLSNYKSSKPLSVQLQPGQEFKFVVKLAPFHFSHSEFLKLQANAIVSGVTYGANPAFIPSFTKIIDFRVFCEYGRGTSGGSDIYEAMAGVLSHHQQQYHSLRMVPQVDPASVHVINKLDTADVTLQHINDDSGNLETPDL